MSNYKNVVKVVGGWDKQDPSNEGWHVEARDALGGVVTDSQKIWFPVSVDDFTREQRPGLLAALALEFDGAEIVVEA